MQELSDHGLLTVLKIYRAVFNDSTHLGIVEEIFGTVETKEQYDDYLSRIAKILEISVKYGYIEPRTGMKNDRITFTFEGLAYYDQHKHLLDNANTTERIDGEGQGTKSDVH